MEMNSHTKLLALLDEVFGPDNKAKSSFRKVSQDYDERTDEHVVLIEYRSREKGTLPTTPKGRQTRKAKLIQQLYAIASQS